MTIHAAASLAFAAAVAATSPAFAEWQVDGGVAIVAPTVNNSTMELFTVSCGDPYQVEVYSRGGPARPDAEGGGADGTDYFYQPGKVEARIDGVVFRLAAAGSDAAVVLFSEGKAADQHLAPLGAAFIAALKGGTTLTLAFDATPDALDGSPFETVAQFPLAGARAALEEALAACP